MGALLCHRMYFRSGEDAIVNIGKEGYELKSVRKSFEIHATIDQNDKYISPEWIFIA